MIEYPPSYVDRHHASLNLTLILALVLAFGGFIRGDQFLFIVGVAFAAYAWLSSPNKYMLFEDRLVIAYGKPRLRTIPFDVIENVELLRLSRINPRLRISHQGGRRTWLVPKDAEAFNERFQEALKRFHESRALEQGSEEG